MENFKFFTRNELEKIFEKTKDTGPFSFIFNNKSYTLFKYEVSNKYVFCDYQSNDITKCLNKGDHSLLITKSNSYIINAESPRVCHEILNEGGPAALSAYLELEELV